MNLSGRFGFEVFHGIFGSYKHFKQHRNIYDFAKIRPALGKNSFATMLKNIVNI